jgi:hypothetical protein
MNRESQRVARAKLPSLFYFSIENTHWIEAVIVIFSGWTGGSGGGRAIFFAAKMPLPPLERSVAS